MLKSWRWLMAFSVPTLFSLLLSGCTSLRPPPFQNGMNYVAWWQGIYQDPQSAEMMQALVKTKRNWISIVVTCYQDAYEDTTIRCDLPRTPTDDDVVFAIRQAREFGLRIMLKPHLDLHQDPTHWRGDIGRSFSSEAEWDAWFASYRQFIRHYATLAEAEGVDQFVVGTELVSTSHREAAWREVVAMVRELFSGQLVYASNHGGEETAVSWWDSLDYIGVDAYYAVSSHDEPQLAELHDAWQKKIEMLAQLSARYNKPILITEIGYRSANGTTMEPWNYHSREPFDAAEQTLAYQAALDMLCPRMKPQPWLAGIYWWDWSPRPERRRFNRNYTPYNKPAAEVLRQHDCQSS